MTTQEEGRHQLDMVPVFKIVRGHDKGGDESQWFSMAESSSAGTRQATGPRNIIKLQANLEVRSNFFSFLVVDVLTAIPVDSKNGKESVPV